MSVRRGRRLRLRELLSDVQVLEWFGDPDVDISAIVHDSRLAARDACFACIVGATTDGHDHAPAATHAGATALLVERRLDLSVSQARVGSVRQVLGPAAARFHDHPSRSMRCLGVTGTNGKTTTTFLLEAIAQAAGERAGVIGTVGARVAGEPAPIDRTTPEADELQMLLSRMRDAGVGTVAMEVSSHALHQRRVDGTWFRVVCFTNLSHEHLDYHGSLEGYFEAKALLFDPTRAGAAVANRDDPHGVEVARRAGARGLPTLTFAIDDRSADVGVGELDVSPAGNTFVLEYRRNQQRQRVRSPLVGRFNVENALAGAATALAAGFGIEAVKAGLEAPVVVPGRFERVSAGQPFPVLVDYAHTPDALERVLVAARPLASDGRVIAVFGCGGDRDREKRPLMGGVAGKDADLVVVTSDNPRSEDPEAIAAAVLAGIHETSASVVVELDRRAAIRHALTEARPGDVVVVAGKGHETGQTEGGATLPFDDRIVVREEVEALGCA